MGRLIDADEFEKFIKQKYSDSETTEDIKDQMLFDLSCQQTVFDLDKVVEQLEEACISPSDYPGYVVDIEKAIEIIKSAGINDPGQSGK